jgi:hypothetical protein
MFQPNRSTETFPKTEPAIVRLGTEVRDLLTKAMKHAGKDAKEVAKEMSERLGGRPITESMIYELTRNGGQGQPREVRLLATWVPAFCEVTGDDRLQRCLAGPQLRQLIALAEGAKYMRSTGLQLLDIAAQLRSYQRGSKAKKKQTRKA